VYTDGSAAEATRDGGAGVFIKYTVCEEKLALPTGKYSTNFRAETVALCTAATTVKENAARTTGQVVLFTDALSVLQTLRSSRNKEMNDLTTALVNLNSTVQNVVLQWIPAHCDIRGNEVADRLAKEGGKMDQMDSQVSFNEARTIIKAIQSKKWLSHHPRYSPSDSYHLLNRREQVTVFRLRTGHSRLRHHLHTKFGIGPNGKCPCNTGHMTPDHILQACPNFNDLRARTWSTVTTLQTKLYGSPEDLRKTAAFVQETGVDI
jgi:ribonuclease HI